MMNLANANLVARTSGVKPVEAQAPSLPDTSSGSEDFANTLKGQEQALKETKGQTEVPVQKRDAPKNSDSEGAPQAGTDDQNELVAMFNKILPPAKAVKENLAADPLPSQPALTGDANTAAPVLASVEAALAGISESGVVVPAMPPVETQALSTALAEPAESDAAPVDIMVPQDPGSALALTGLAFVKPMPDQAKTVAPLESAAPEILSLKQIVSDQSAQTSPKVNLTGSDRTESFEQTLADVVEPQSAAPEITTEWISAAKMPADTRLDSPALTLSKPLTHPGWSKDLGEQILWMNNKEISAAEIKLNPAHLGPISVRIDINQDNQTSILFNALHAETKDALESSIPKLKEMLQGQQLNLVNVNISQHSFSNNGRPPSQAFYGTPGSQGQGFEAAPEPLDINESGSSVSKGLLSLYA